jgi:hypothetical protein
MPTKTKTTNTKAARKTTRAAALSVAQAQVSQTADPSPGQIRSWWENDRAKRILSIMRTDDISYSRAVKRSRRRMIRDGEWS